MTITVDCPPLKTDNGGKSLEQWNKDVAAFEAANPEHRHQDDLGRRPVRQPAGLHRPAAGWHPGRRLLRLHDRPRPGARRRRGRGHHPVRQQGHHPELGRRARLGEGAVHRGRQDLRHRLLRLTPWAWSTTRRCSQQAGLDPTKPPTTWQEVATAAKTIADARSRASPATRSTAPATPVAGTSPRRVYSRGSSPVSADGKKANVKTPEAKAVLQNLKDMRFTRQQRRHDAAADLAGPADQRRRRQGRHVHRRAGLDHRDREHLQGQATPTGRSLRCPVTAARPRARSVAATATSSRRA